MNRIIKHISMLLSAVLLLTGCGSSRLPGLSDDKGRKAGDVVVEKMLSMPSATDFSAHLSVSSGGSSVSGQLRMRRDKSITISVSLLGLVEVARIELLSDHVVLIDRTNRRYCSTTYSDVPLLGSLGIDFYTIQAMLWNRAFVPDCRDVKEAMRSIEYTGSDNNYRTSRYGYTFTADTDGNLVETRLIQGGRSLSFKYLDRVDVDGETIPSQWRIAVSDLTGLESVSIKLGSISLQPGRWTDQTTISSRYKEVTAAELLEMLDDLDL